MSIPTVSEGEHFTEGERIMASLLGRFCWVFRVALWTSPAREHWKTAYFRVISKDPIEGGKLVEQYVDEHYPDRLLNPLYHHKYEEGV